MHYMRTRLYHPKQTKFSYIFMSNKYNHNLFFCFTLHNAVMYKRKYEWVENEYSREQRKILFVFSFVFLKLSVAKDTSQREL